ncbi:MAG: DUF1732 domain-containing protein [Kiritimatiellaeota bacterium]|nr:DUF1732 domain-containing protein [Kiritimatiellota bacterium]
MKRVDVRRAVAFMGAVCAAAGLAAAKLDGMRDAEGARLAEDIMLRCGVIRALVARIEVLAPGITQAYHLRLKERVRELTEGAVAIPEDRIAVEAAIFADKSNITEETVRLDSHLRQMEAAIKGDGASDGRKLDFLVQEMNREANTIGSKANNIEVTNMMIEIKGEIEKIREQIQNVQ